MRDKIPIKDNTATEKFSVDKSRSISYNYLRTYMRTLYITQFILSIQISVLINTSLDKSDLYFRLTNTNERTLILIDNASLFYGHFIALRAEFPDRKRIETA